MENQDICSLSKRIGHLERHYKSHKRCNCDENITITRYNDLCWFCQTIETITERKFKDVSKNIDDLSTMINKLNKRSIKKSNKIFHEENPNGYLINPDCWGLIKKFMGLKKVYFPPYKIPKKFPSNKLFKPFTFYHKEEQYALWKWKFVCLKFQPLNLKHSKNKILVSE